MIIFDKLSQETIRSNIRTTNAWYESHWAIPRIIKKYRALDWAHIVEVSDIIFPHVTAIDSDFWCNAYDSKLRDILNRIFETIDPKPESWTHVRRYDIDPNHYFLFESEEHKMVFDLLISEFYVHD